MEGTPFGRYRLVELIGRGGMGEVWRAYDTATERVVALKVLPAHAAKDETFVERFRREAHAAARLSSPHVVPIHTHGEIEGRLYVDMRLIEGRDLQTELSRGPMDFERAVRIIEQVAKALHAAHKVGLIHRDVKPSNILLDQDDFVYLIDFGIARAAGETGLTSTGALIGTWHYMAPERMSAGTADERSDIYALACVLHECWTGDRPYPGDSVESQIAGHLTAPPPRPSSVRAGVPTGFDEVIAKGMAKNPGERYQTTLELARAARESLTAPEAVDQSPLPALPEPAWSHAPQPTVRPEWAPPVQPEPIPWGPPQPPPQAPAPSPRTPAPRSRGTSKPRRGGPVKRIILSAIVILCIGALTATVIYLVNAQKGESPHTAGDAGRTTTLPFSGLEHPESVAVSTNGTVYVAEQGKNRVVALDTYTGSETVVPFDGLNFLGAVAVDAGGTVFVTDIWNKRVLSWPPGATNQRKLSFSGLDHPSGVAAGKDGAVYVVDAGNNRVLALPPGSADQVVMPFAGLNYPYGVAVGNNGTVYVTDNKNKRLLALAAGATSQAVVASTGLSNPSGVAVDEHGTVYVADGLGKQVVSIAAGSGARTVLPVAGLQEPTGVAVDREGNVYVADVGTNRVVKFAAA